MPKRYIFAIIIVILFSIGLWLFGIKTSKNHIPEYEERLLKIEKLLDSLNSKKDSIRTIIVTVDREIIKNNKEHEKVYNNIIVQPSSVDSIFAREYIQKFIDERVR